MDNLLPENNAINPHAAQDDQVIKSVELSGDQLSIEKAEADTPQPYVLSNKVIGKLIATLNINRVVYVDDYFDFGIEKVIEHIVVGIAKNKLEEIQSVLPQVEEEARDSWESEIRSYWDQTDVPTRRSIMQQLLALKLIPDTEDKVAANALDTLIRPQVENYHPVTPEDWDANKDAWFAEASTEKKLLCLFDIQFTHLRAGTQVPVNGIIILEEAINAVGAKEDTYDGKALFGLFSHEFTIDSEREKGEEICQEHHIPKNLFLPLSKKRHRDPDKLAAGLQMLVLNIYTITIKDIIKDAIGKAYTRTSEELDKLDVFAFDDMVLHSSLKEGVWEGETMIRLFVLLLQKHGWDDLASSPRAGRFNELIRIARELASPRLIKSKTQETPKNWRRLELYQEKESLNAFHTPLRLGDIFELNSKYQYILLSPPCDLMVRSGSEETMGRRGRKETEVKYVDLFRIKDISYENVNKLTGEQLSVLGFLKNYKTNKFGRISFKERIIIPIEVLDLAVLNSEGICQLNLANKPEIPAQFHPAWLERYTILINHFDKWIEPIKYLNIILAKPELTHQERESLELTKSNYLNPGTSLPGGPTYENDILDFKFRRVANYRHSASQHLLTAYSHFLSRAAEDHDFSIGNNVTAEVDKKS